MNDKPIVILSNQAQFIHCGDSIWSSHRHDYKECSCGKLMVDGGMDYIRRGGKPEDHSKCSKCGGPRDNGWGCGECEEGCCDPITEDCHADAAIHAIDSHDALTARVAELEAAINKMRSIVTDVQDGFEVVGSDAEILDLINETLEAKS